MDISHYVNRNNILSNVQSGVSACYSCKTALLKITDDTIAATDSGNLSILSLLEAYKAFDTVADRLLLEVFRSKDFCDSAVAIGSFLYDAEQCGQLSGKRSE